jgi:hypothetical protein
MVSTLSLKRMNITRYFKDGGSFWKFEHGKRPQIRTEHSPVWGDSVFTTLEEFLSDPHEVEETCSCEAETEVSY